MTATGYVETVSHAAHLPDYWDTAAGDQYFLQRASLQVLENTNPCNQRYHFIGEADTCSIAVTYRHRLNLLTFGFGSLSLPVTIIGIPCSVSGSGCCFSPQTQDKLVNHLHKIPGIKLVLNSTEPGISGFRKGTTLPTCMFSSHWNDFAHYFSSMRSHYRYRIKTAMARWSGIEEASVPAGSFDPELHRLYENVYHRSQYKLEKLDVDFFRKFPADITRFSVHGKPIAFVQTVPNGDELIFMFAGMDYSTSWHYDTYLNILLFIIRKGIEAGFKFIDMGQTAEEIKCKLGCRPVSRNLHVAHSNRIANRILQPMTGLLSYKEEEHEYRVFKSFQP